MLAGVEAELKRELKRFQQKYGLGLELKGVGWMPGEGELSGEIRGGIIYVYDREAEKVWGV